MLNTIPWFFRFWILYVSCQGYCVFYYVISYGRTYVFREWCYFIIFLLYWSLSGVSCLVISVPDPPDPHVFWPPGSGSISQRYGSGSFHHHAKIVRKTLITSVLWPFLTFYLWKIMSRYHQKVISRKILLKISFLLASWRPMTKIAGSGSVSGSISQKHGSEDPDPPQNVMDPEHC